MFLTPCPQSYFCAPMTVCYILYQFNCGQQFKNRLQQFSIIEPVALFFVNLFNPQIDVFEILWGKLFRKKHLQLKMILNIQTDIVLKLCTLNKNIWNEPVDKKYPLL